MATKDEGSKGIERRREERVAARLGVRFVHKEDAARALRAYSLNLSVGGLCIRTQKAYTVGEKLQLAIEVGEELFELDAVVAWVRPQAVGVRFTNLAPPDRERLSQLVAGLKKS